MPAIESARVLIMAADGFGQGSFLIAQGRLMERGADVYVATPEGAPIRGWDEDDWGEHVEADLAVAEARAADFDALVLPGGRINPDILRARDDAVALVRAFHDAGRVVAAMCHAGSLLIEAGLARGREVTSFPSIRTDLRNAGATWVDREAVVSDRIVTARGPADVGAFVAAIVAEVERLGAAPPA